MMTRENEGVFDQAAKSALEMLEAKILQLSALGIHVPLLAGLVF